jgi:hypothetical protein
MKFKALVLSCFVALSSINLPALSQIPDISRFPVLRISDWRTPDVSIPWSEPVVINDEFEGNYLAVFDKNYHDDIWSGNKRGIISNWSRKYLRIYSYYSPRCRGLFCTRPIIINETDNVTIKAGNQIFRIEGQDGNFNLTDEVAYALKHAPPGQAKIKVLFKGSGREVVNDIGRGTVDAWKIVYQDAKKIDSNISIQAPNNNIQKDSPK